jgi:hypothetical protein
MKCFVLTILFCLAVVGCSSDKPTKPNEPPAVLPVYAKDYIHFPDSNVVFHLAIRCQSDLADECEPFLEEEAVIGEPFIDMNDNGQFDSGIDSFIVSPDPAINQDYNFNGQYDGPDGLWSYDYDERIPWDDIDGNGKRRSTSGAMDADADSRYAPFRDWNNNGIWDSLVSAAEDYYYFLETESPVIKYSPRQATGFTYQYTSDSGIAYSPNIHRWGTFPYFDVRMSQDSFVAGIGDYGNLFLADSSEILSDSGSLQILRIRRDTTYISRRVVLDTSLMLDDTLFEHLLWYRFDSIRTDGSIDPWRANEYWEFFFDKRIGIVAHGAYGFYALGPHMFYFHDVWTGDSTLPLVKTPRP